jgi:hypothetical protein
MPKAEEFIEIRTTNYEMQKNTAKCTFPVQSAIEVFISTANCELRNAKKTFPMAPQVMQPAGMDTSTALRAWPTFDAEHWVR